MRIKWREVLSAVLDVKFNKQKDVYNWGEENGYPQLINALVGMSVTAQNCVNKVAKSIYGGGFGEEGAIVVNSLGQSLNEVLRIAAREYAKYNNCFIAVGYNANYSVNSINVLPCTDVRVGKADDLGYSGKFLVSSNWKGKADDIRVIDRYNSDPIAIQQQIDAAGGLGRYKGQILHIKRDPLSIYSLSDLDSVQQDALTEGNSATFRSRGASRGFLNTKMLVVPPFASDDERGQFHRELNSQRGATNSSDTLVLELENNTDDVSKIFSLSDFSGNYNDRLFEYSDTISERNICKAFGVPVMLVNPSDSSLFGSSGEMLREAKDQLYESCKEEREQFEEVFTSLLSLMGDIAAPLQILNPYVEVEDVAEAKNINKQAQATLRGSVGGVTALISLCESVKNGTITQDSAVAIIVAIYGYSEKKARAMIGYTEPAETNPQTTV